MRSTNCMHLHVVPHAAHLIPPSCLPNHSQRVLHCMCVLRTSGTRVWTCSLISGLLCIFSLLKKQHVTSAAPMMIVSFSPSTHLVSIRYVPPISKRFCIVRVILHTSLRYVQGYVNDTNRLLAYICCVPPGMKTRNLCVWGSRGHVIFGALDIITFDTTTLRV